MQTSGSPLRRATLRRKSSRKVILLPLETEAGTAVEGLDDDTHAATDTRAAEPGELYSPALLDQDEDSGSSADEEFEEELDDIEEEDNTSSSGTGPSSMAGPVVAVPSSMPGPVVAVDEDAQRFHARPRAMIQFIHNWVPANWEKNVAQEWEDRAIAKSFANFFKNRSAKFIFDTVIAMVPLQTQSLLGKKDLRPADLLQLPAIPEEDIFWGVYMDIATLLDRDPPAVEGLYAGSSVAVDSYPGVRGRVAQHISASSKPYDTLHATKISLHYWVICRPEVKPNFRAIALGRPVQIHKTPTVLLEGLTCIYFNIVSPKPSHQNPLSSINLTKEIRQHVNQQGHGNLPDFEHLGLNKALPLHQGVPRVVPRQVREHKEWARSHPDVCGNPACGRARPKSSHRAGWEGYKEDTRCVSCSKYRKANGVDDPEPAVTFEMHQEWVQAGNADVCSGCQTQRPDDWKRWRAFREKSRCERCYRASRAKPSTILTFEDHDKWVKAGNADVCSVCKIQRPDNWRKRWKGFCEHSRCSSCYKKRGAPVQLRSGDHKDWVKAGNADVCSVCKTQRPDDWPKKGWRGFCQWSLCNRCYLKKRPEK